MKTNNSPHRTKKKTVFAYKRIRWTFWLAMSAIIGSALIYGVFAYLIVEYQQVDILYIIFGVALINIVIGCSIRQVLYSIEKKLSPLVEGLHEVADGNLDILLDTQKSGEFEPIYNDFNAMTLELKKTKESMQSFINEFAHEFKTPITSISGFADVLYQTGEGIEDEERMEFLKIISEQSHRLSNLAQNTLLLSKVEATQIITEKENFSLSEQIKRCSILMLPQIEQKHITIDIAEDLDFSYYGNEELMEQIWINLLNNAIKFTPEGGEIYIYSKRSSDSIKISIKDSGTGMDEETMLHIFDKYYQNDSTSIVKGNGIGLSIVKRIVELCNGHIDVESAVGKGSVFTVTLPIGEMK